MGCLVRARKLTVQENLRAEVLLLQFDRRQLGLFTHMYRYGSLARELNEARPQKIISHSVLGTSGDPQEDLESVTEDRAVI